MSFKTSHCHEGQITALQNDARSNLKEIDSLWCTEFGSPGANCWLRTFISYWLLFFEKVPFFKENQTPPPKKKKKKKREKKSDLKM